MSQRQFVKELPITTTVEAQYPLSSLLAPSAAPTSIHRHTGFWDKTNKGYITPLDTISGFITLGYGVVFSVAVGSVLGVFLSVSTQPGWIPDPLSDKSQQTITITELMRMTKEQNNLGKDFKAWTTSMIELCALYFFTGHKGIMSKEDIQSAYDGTFFYRLRDKNKLLIQGKGHQINNQPLKGRYLSKSSSSMDIKAMERKMELLLSSLQSKRSVTGRYGINDALSYLRETVSELKNQAVPSPFKRSPSMIDGVKSPKPPAYRRSRSQGDMMTISLSDGLTGTMKRSEGLMNLQDELSLNELSSNFLINPDNNEDAIGVSDTLLRTEADTHKTPLFADGYDKNCFVGTPESTPNEKYLRSLVYEGDTQTGRSTPDSGRLSMNDFLNEENEDNLEKLSQVQLTGVLKETDDPSRNIEQVNDDIRMERELIPTLEQNNERKADDKSQLSYQELQERVGSNQDSENDQLNKTGSEEELSAGQHEPQFNEQSTGVTRSFSVSPIAVASTHSTTTPLPSPPESLKKNLELEDNNKDASEEVVSSSKEAIKSNTGSKKGKKVKAVK
ncbi:hypothetical protein BDF20DRAFT_200518 [Mycotypha africana]|uniref:uncharacterized protein n=1 Tax=Mycotypha africana TaxID=64632 RepID=UPI0022FFD009|nr:uncharacterized protein BDF20DRAFT_200518 [Mycotypha africana]KAI8967945.1 hypothetical protein BDF20DRAFT_200518 [Mycotypha africana]